MQGYDIYRSGTAGDGPDIAIYDTVVQELAGGDSAKLEQTRESLYGSYSAATSAAAPTEQAPAASAPQARAPQVSIAAVDEVDEGLLRDLALPEATATSESKRSAAEVRNQLTMLIL